MLKIILKSTVKGYTSFRLNQTDANNKILNVDTNAKVNEATVVVDRTDNKTIIEAGKESEK